MRALYASSIGVTCAAALLLSFAPGTPSALSPLLGSDTDAEAASPVRAPAATGARVARSGRLPGSTQSLPIPPPPGQSGRPDRTGSLSAPDGAGGGQGVRRFAPRKVKPFSLIGVVWDDADAEMRARVQVRTRAANSGKWSAWRDLDTHSDHGPDRSGTAERAGGQVRGGTAPLWVGHADGAQVRMAPKAGGNGGQDGGSLGGLGGLGWVKLPPLPGGMRLELVNPGPDPGDPGGESPEDPAKQPGEGEQQQGAGGAAGGGKGARPDIVTRAGWGADESLREPGYAYTRTVKMAFVHHTAMRNDYACSQVPAIIRSIYRYHVQSSKWRDIGYNFLIDKCGKVYEGRAGGVAKPVMGAHTYGFNTDSAGIAVLGSYGSAQPPAPAADSLARLIAWKLGLHGVDPGGSTWMVSGGGKYQKGKKVKFHTIAGHRDGYNTACPGDQLYRKLGSVRSAATRFQSR